MRIFQNAWSTSEAADLYERARPGYAPQAVDFVARAFRIEATSTILDLAAGTGKLTRQLKETRARLVAIEPLPGMRSAFARALPEVDLRPGKAEAIPLDDESVDLVIVGQAWHWFDSRRALAEVTRVVKPNGGLALMWNDYDESVGWVHDYAEIRKWVSEPAPWKREEAWQVAFDERPDWTTLEVTRFRHVSHSTRTGLVERMLSSSVMVVLPDPDKSRITRGILDVLDRHDETRGRATLAVPYITTVFTSSRVG